MLPDTAKSRLGHLLIAKGLINPYQLRLALNLQVSTGMRLGEVLIHQGVLTEKQIKQVLSNQRRQRLWASILALVLGPLSFPALAGQNANESKTNKPSVVLSQKQSSLTSPPTISRSIDNHKSQNPE